VVGAALLGSTLAFADTGSASSRPPSVQQTIDDPALNVTWLADADLPASLKLGLGTAQKGLAPINQDGSMQYATALEWVRRLNHYRHKGYLGHNDWTLPITPTPYSDRGCSGFNAKGGGNFGNGCTAAPLAELYVHMLGLSGPDTAVAIPDASTGPFHDFQPYLYWSDTPNKTSAGGFDTQSFNTDWPGSNQNDHWMYVLPMLPGNPFHAGGQGLLQAVDGGQAVYERGAGVTWLADADLAKTQRYGYGASINADGSMEQSTAAADWVPALDTHALLGQHKGWTLPSAAELAQLYPALRRTRALSAEQPVVPVPNTNLHGFRDIQPYLYWSCAGATVEGPCHGVPNPNNQQWSFSFGNGYLGTDVLQNSLYVMVYYPNRVPLPPAPVKGGCPPHKPGTPITCS